MEYIVQSISWNYTFYKDGTIPPQNSKTFLIADLDIDSLKYLTKLVIDKQVTVEPSIEELSKGFGIVEGVDPEMGKLLEELRISLTTEFQNDLKVLTDTVSGVSEGLSEIEGELPSIIKEQGTLKTNYESLSTKANTNSTSIGTIDTKVKAMEPKLTAVETKASANATTLGTLSPKVSANETKSNTNATNIGTLTTRVTALEAKVTTSTYTSKGVLIKNTLQVAGECVSDESGAWSFVYEGVKFSKILSVNATAEATVVDDVPAVTLVSITSTSEGTISGLAVGTDLTPSTGTKVYVTIIGE